MLHQAGLHVIRQANEDFVILLKEKQSWNRKEENRAAESQGCRKQQSQKRGIPRKGSASRGTLMKTLRRVDSTVNHVFQFGAFVFSMESNYPRGMRNWILLSTFALAACSTSGPDRITQEPDAPLVEDKYRLQGDREALDKLRSDIPEERKRENDDLAFMLQWMGETKMPPGQVREKFNKAVSKSRSDLQKDLGKRREDFVRNERRDRDEKMRELDERRKSFQAGKPDREKSREFYAEQDRQRKDFHAGQRERRDTFEADIRDRRKNFDDYVREKTQEFNQEHRAYTKRFDDWKKENREKQKLEDEARAKKARDAEAGFEKIDQKPATPLGTEE